MMATFTKAASISALVLGLTACGTPQSSGPNPTPTSNSTVKADEAKTDTTAAKDKAADSKQSKADQQANLRREIAVKKDQLSRLQQDLSRKDGLLQNLEGRLGSIASTRAGVVPEVQSTSVFAAAINQDYAGVYSAYASKKSSEAAAAKKKTNLDAIQTKLNDELKLAQEDLAKIEANILALETEIEDMTAKFDELK